MAKENPPRRGIFLYSGGDPWPPGTHGKEVPERRPRRFGNRAGNVQKDAHSEKERYERRTAIAHERERYARKRQYVEVDSHVQGGLHENPKRHSGREVFSERIRGFRRDPETAVSDETVRAHERQDPEESELFRYDREDEVALGFRKVSEFLDGFPESETEESAGTDGNEALFRLEVDGLLLDGRFIVRKVVVDTFGHVGEFALMFAFAAQFSYAVYQSAHAEEYEAGNG